VAGSQGDHTMYLPENQPFYLRYPCPNCQGGEKGGGVREGTVEEELGDYIHSSESVKLVTT
jgi:hypothetical protein